MVGVNVAVKVAVIVGVYVAVKVGVIVGVFVDVGVRVNVGVKVGVKVAVGVNVLVAKKASGPSPWRPEKTPKTISMRKKPIPNQPHTVRSILVMGRSS
jgi:hypothetical protein